MVTAFKTFKDLIFVSKPYGEGFHAIKNFPNGHGVSVITEGNSYTCPKHDLKLLFYEIGKFDMILR